MKISFRELLPLLLLVFELFCTGNLKAQNSIVTENQLPGTPQNIWDAPDGTGIQGFATDFSVNKGSIVTFKVDLPLSVVPENYTIQIYRIGYYQGNGARLVADLGTFTGSAQPQPLYDTATGKYDCSNWAESASWQVPANAVSGVYLAKLESANDASHIYFIVRDDFGNAAMLFKTSDATWQAYNKYDGNNLYEAATPVPGHSHAVKISYNRPFVLRGDKSSFFNAEYPMIRWLERNGYDVSYTTDVDMARDLTPIVPQTGIPGTYAHQVLLSVGHDEYWSPQAKTTFENARNAGVHLGFFSGNEVYWKIRWEDDFKTLVCYKEGLAGEYTCGGNCDPTDEWTGLWRDGCDPVYEANDGCDPEGPLTGQMSWTQSNGSIHVPFEYRNYRFWRHTSIASLAAGSYAELPYGTLGNEWDPDVPTNIYPEHRIKLSHTEQFGHRHHLSLYRHASGAWVFGAGTMQWSWGLDENHDLGDNPQSLDMQQATVNLFIDMGQIPVTPQQGIIVPQPVTDNLPPVSTIISPIHNSTIAGSFITIAGTVSEAGGGAVAGVEVSTDGGLTWKPAYGTDNWTFSLTTTNPGTMIIKVRAWDDYANVEIPGVPGSNNCISINITGPFSYSVFPPTLPSSMPVFNPSGTSLEVGMKFQSSVPGFITGAQYYKNAGNQGQKTGHLWTSGGTLLAEAIFTNETISGWQQAQFSTPVPIVPDSIYVISVFSENGSFLVTNNYFSNSQVNGFLTGLSDTQASGNGVYAYADSSVFPDQSVSASNYWVDVLFEISDLTPPEIISVIPALNATAVSHTTGITIHVSEKLNPATVNGTTVIAEKAGSQPVNGTVSLNGKIITFQPSVPLDLNSVYTVTLSGGVNGQVIKDLSGNALIENYSWSFTTEDYSSPVIIMQPANQNACDNSLVTFKTQGYGLPSPAIQWEISTDGQTWNIIPGANTPDYEVQASTSVNGNRFRAVYSNSEGSVTTNAAQLNIISSVNATITAVNGSICSGSLYELQLTSALGQAPFSAVINGVNYDSIFPGEIFAAIPSYEGLWNNNITPSGPSLPDPNSVELGIRFRVLSDGYIQGIKFYKGTGNTGIHKGSLWDANGNQLATNTYNEETASGWQQMYFSTPVAVTANSIYTASYFAPNGHYSRDEDYFVSNYSNGSLLEALPYSLINATSVYKYNSTSTYPDQNPGPHNYWVDVIFSYPDGYQFNSQLTFISDNSGCTGSGNPLSETSATIALTTQPTFTQQPGSNVCMGTEITYATQPNQYNYIWSIDGSEGTDFIITDGDVSNMSSTFALKWITPGVKSVTVTYASGECSLGEPAIASVNVMPHPVVTITGDSILCPGTSISLETGIFENYTWNTGAQTSSIQVTAAGNYFVSVTDEYGCVGTSAPFIVNQGNNPVPLITGELNVCNGDSTQLHTGNFSQYLWSTGQTTGSINAIAGTYILTVWNQDGCQGTTDVIVSDLAVPEAVLSGGDTICNGSSSELQIEFTGNGPWTYALNGETIQSSSVSPVILNVAPSSNTTYQVTTINDSLCPGISSGSAFIKVNNPLFNSAFHIDTFVTSSCQGNVENFIARELSSVNHYTWTSPAGTLINGLISPVITTSPEADITFGAVPPATTGWNICVTATNACNTTNIKCRFIKGKLNKPSVITGSKIVCPGSVQSYSINPVASATDYLWTGTNGITFIGSGTSVQAVIPAGFESGTICVSGTLPCGYVGPSRCLNVSNKIGNIGAISGTLQLCPGQTGVVYNVPAVSGAVSYTWSVPNGITIVSGQGTNQITVNVGSRHIGGQVCVYATSACGLQTVQKCKFTTSLRPGSPGSISGSNFGVCGQTVTYSILPVSGATSYNWTIPAGATLSSPNGSNSIDVTFSNSYVTGQVCVTTANSCTNGGTKCLVVKGAPNKASPINGPVSVCNNQQNIHYDVPAINGATQYTWTVPPGATVVSGQGTTSVMVDWGTNSGNVSVKAGNQCGNSANTSLAVNISCRESEQQNITNGPGYIKIYPNPVSNQVTIEIIHESENETASFFVKDISGRIVYHEMKKLQEGMNVFSLDVSGFEKGIYLLDIVKTNTPDKNLRFVVN